MRRCHQTGQSVHPKHLGPWSGAGDLSELVDGYLTGLRVSREVVVDEGRAVKKAISRLYSLTSCPFAPRSSRRR